MNRPVPFLQTGLRAVALAAFIGGQSACVQRIPVAPGPTVINRSAVSASSETMVSAAVPNSSEGESGPPKVVIRDYWRSPRATVIAWNADESWQGLRTGVRLDGSVPYDHMLYFSLSSVPNLNAFAGANWYAFSDTAVGGQQLKVYGTMADQFNCQGKNGCSPYRVFQARVPDSFLRSTHDSLIVKVVSYDGHETEIALRGALISSYLAKVDSVSAARKGKSASNHQ